MRNLIEWILSTPASALMIDYRWSWPIAESIHFIGLMLMAGTVAVFDLRLLGVGRGIRPITLHRLLRFGIAGFSLSVVTGVLFISGAPDQYFFNRAFWFKSACLIGMGINVAVFYTRGFGRVREMGPDDDASMDLKLMAALSLLFLTGVMLGGRMLTFFRPPAYF
jgi:hypothetical protein